MTMKFNALLSVFLLSLTLLITGCTPKGELLAQELQAAWSNQQEIHAHQMSGNAELQLDLALSDAEQQPLTSAILQSLLHSKYEWEGASDAEAARFETEMTLTPADSDISIHLPILIEESMLYFHLPMINKADEYMEIPLGEQFVNTAGQVQGIFASWLEGFSSIAEPAWLTESEADIPEQRSIHITINEERLPLFMNAAADQWEQLIVQLTESGLDTTTLDNAAFGEYLRQAAFSEEGHLSFTLNENDYIQDVELYLPFLSDGNNQEQSNEQLISIHYTWDRINEEIKFNQSRPAQTKTLDTIYPLIH